jgi:hypothetical protein
MRHAVRGMMGKRYAADHPSRPKATDLKRPTRSDRPKATDPKQPTRSNRPEATAMSRFLHLTAMSRFLHLCLLVFTSFGGDPLGGEQMSSLRRLEAGATASYGTVSEPCSHWQTFPHPAVLLRHYAAGNSAIEAYWNSVAWPTEGLFIGAPLAAPTAGGNAGADWPDRTNGQS